MRQSDIKKETHRRVVRMQERVRFLGCPICGPNRGCNKRDKKRQRSWKINRKNRYI